MDTPTRKMRDKIAKWLDKNSDYCWVELFFWSIGSRPFWSLLIDNEEYKNQICRKENKDTPFAYCNKCELTGKFYEK